MAVEAEQEPQREPGTDPQASEAQSAEAGAEPLNIDEEAAALDRDVQAMFGTQPESSDEPVAQDDPEQISNKKESLPSSIWKVPKGILKSKASKPAKRAKASAAAEGGGEEKEKKAKQRKEKKPKKPKENKPKQKKEKQKKQSKQLKISGSLNKSSSGGEKDGEGKGSEGKKKLPILVAGIAGGIIAIGGGIFTAMMIAGGNEVDYAKIYEKAESLRAEEKYDEAQGEYNRIINSEDAVDAELVADSYLGLAETYLSMQISDTAISTLQSGYERTDAIRIKEKLDELEPREDQDSQGYPDSPEASADEPVVWTDPAMEKMIRIALDKTDAQQIMSKDLDGIRSLKIVGPTHAAADKPLNAYNSMDGYTIDNVLYSERGQIRSLNDLKYFKNLKKLVICYNQVNDVRGISEITSLETLGLYANDLSDISAVAGLKNLKYLYIFNNSISDISALKSLSNLSQIYAQHNQIADLSPLKGLEGLTQLYLGNNEITDISPLSGLPKLSFLYADNNGITDIGVVEQIPELTDVSFKNNPVKDLTPASRIQHVNKVVSDIMLMIKLSH